jgi:hypothetical protein
VQALASFDQIDSWIRDHHDGDADVAVFLRGSARETFLVVFAVFVKQFGAPDYPNAAGDVVRESLRFPEEAMLAIWDFDYYRLSLRLENVDADATVLLARHDNSTRPGAKRRRSPYEEGRDALIATFDEKGIPTTSEVEELDSAWNSLSRTRR